jgi:Ca2+-binding RTX toxin-like protein
MTKVKITPAEDGILFNWAAGGIQLATENPEMVTFVDAQSNYVLKIKGDGLQSDGETLIDGRVDQLSFFNEKGQLALRVTGEYAGRELGEYLDDGDPAVFESFLFSGSDTFVGSKRDDYIFSGAGDDKISGFAGRDEIYGGIGKDMLTGGLGSDIFFFGPGSGKDKITDFDPNGGGHKQDYLSTGGVAFDDIEFRKAGDDVLMDLGNGDVIRLLDVKLTDIDETDFLQTLPLPL